MNKKKDVIKISSKRQLELSTKLTSADQRYLILTEVEEKKPPIVKTKVYLEGMVIDIIKTNLLSDDEYNVKKEMERQHERVVQQLKEKRPHLADKVDYFRKIKAAMNRESFKEAFEITDEALQHYPKEPLLLSYYGYFTAILKNDYDRAEELCKEAISISIQGNNREELQILLPTLYLNLGRVYLKGDMKRRAIESFRKGLKVDPSFNELKRELDNLGTRRKPVVPFLGRNNPVNKYLGLFLSRLKR